MRLLRVGDVGEEACVVMDVSGATFAVPSALGDFTPGFWERDGVGELALELGNGSLAPFDITGRRIGVPRRHFFQRF